MATVNVGTGGDYANIGDAWAAIVGGALSENLTWLITSNQTVTSWASGSVALNGYSFTVNYSGIYHNGIPTDGYKITNNTNISFTFTAASLIGSFTIKNIHITGGSVTINQLYSYPSAIMGQNITVQNILFDNGTYFVIQGVTSDRFKISNMKIWDCAGAAGVSASFRITLVEYLFTGYCYAENITMWNCHGLGASTGGSMFYLQAPVGQVYTLKNIAACDPDSSASCFGASRTSITYTNCAGTDSSLATFDDVNCITVTSANEFKSLDDSSDDFLVLLEQSVGDLSDSGIAPEDVTLDIAGLAIPQAGNYPIGCHASYTITEGYIRFVYGATMADVKPPRYGYATEVSMPLTYCHRQGQSYGIHDSGTDYDTRKCIGVKFDLPATSLSAVDMNAFTAFFQSIDYGRQNTVQLQLGTNSGFFPFGPDYGDSGTFTVRITRYNPGGQKLRPFKWWAPEIDMQMISSPSYSFTDDMDEGTVQIGTVTGLKYPQTGYDVNVRIAANNLITQGSDAYLIDGGTSADEYENEFTFDGNQGKMAELLQYMVSARGSDAITYIAPLNNYPFGRSKNANGSFTVQLLHSQMLENQAIIRVVHERFDKFSIQTGMRFIA
jgi:hypothetical protein